MAQNTIPKESMRFLLFCSAGLVVFILLSIYPAQRRIMDLKRENREIHARLEQHQILFPVYVRLHKLIHFEVPEVLVVPVREKLPHAEIARISSILSELGAGCGLEVMSAAPQADSLKATSDLLLVHILLIGELPAFREFMMVLEKQPYVEYMERVQIRPVQAAKEFTLKVWIAID